MDKKYVLVINPGSTSTKVAVYDGLEKVIIKKIEHSTDELKKFKKIHDQYEYRKDLIENWLTENGVSTGSLKAVVGRGGLLHSMPGGTYKVTDRMIEDLKIGVQGEHASNLGGIIAKGIADEAEVDAFIVDPVAVDEFEEIARISGMPEIKRKSLIHALNIKAVAHRFAKQENKNLTDLNLIVAHLGGGISVSPVSKGRAIDVNNANEMGPFSPERAGGLPVGDFVKMCYSGKYTYKEMKTKLKGKGGLVGYLGTNNAKEVGEMINNGDEKAELVFRAMAYQIGKEIGSMAVVLKGNVDGIILTGGLAYSQFLTENIRKMVEFISPVTVYPGEDELEALNEGVLRVLDEGEKFKIYEEEVNLDD